MAAPLPVNLKAIQPYLKVANDMRTREPVVAYYCDMHAMQQGMKIDSKSPDCKTFLLQLMTSLEKQKSSFAADPEKKEQLSSEMVGEAAVEEKALKLFGYADSRDRKSEFGKNVVRAFYTSSVLFDVAEGLCDEEGLSDEAKLHRKYARWKATYIHNCLKNGETPQPGPVGGLEDSFEGLDEDGDIGAAAGPSTSSYNPPQPVVPAPAAAEPPRPVARTKPLEPVPSPQVYDPTPAYTTTGGVELGPLEYTQAQKLCKYASSAIMYQDVPTALENLEKCMRLLKTGKETP